MMRAWVCRTVSALWIHEAIQESRAVSKPSSAAHEELVTKITTLLKNASPPDAPRCSRLQLRNPEKLNYEELLREFVKEIVENGTIPKNPPPRSCEDGSSDWHDWLLANESKGDLRSTDLRAIFDLGASSWEEFEDPHPSITHGVSNTTLAPTESESEEAKCQKRLASSKVKGQRDARAASLVRDSYCGLPCAELESQ